MHKPCRTVANPFLAHICGMVLVGTFRLPAGRSLITAPEPSPDINAQGNGSQHEHKMYQRHDRNFWRMVLYPFPPGQQGSPRHCGQEFPCSPQHSPEASPRRSRSVPKQMVDNPARDFPMNRDSHPRSVAPPCGIEKYRFTWNVNRQNAQRAAELSCIHATNPT